MITLDDVRAVERAAGAVHEPGPELDRLIAEREQVRVAYRQAEPEAGQ